MKSAIIKWLLDVLVQKASAQAANEDLLQPLSDGCTNIFTNGAQSFEILLNYIGCSTQFLYDAAVGFCVLWVVVGGIQIIISGDNTEWYNRGKSVMIASIGGLLTLLLAPVILRFLNPIFFQ